MRERDRWTRTRFAVAQPDVAAVAVVVIDEFGSNLDLTPRSARAVASVPRNTPPNMTTICALTTRGMGPSMLIAGGVTTAVFEAYVEHVLGPTLRPGQISMRDNLSAHTSRRLPTVLAARGWSVWYLPTYSPDYSPIELAFAKVKTELQRRGARTHETLEVAVAHALTHSSLEEAWAFFLHCGFRRCPALAQWFCY